MFERRSREQHTSVGHTRSTNLNVIRFFGGDAFFFSLRSSFLIVFFVDPRSTGELRFSRRAARASTIATDL